MATAWENKLLSLRDRLLSAKELIGSDFDYGVVQTPHDLRIEADAGRFQFYAGHGPPMECLGITVKEDLHQFHCVYPLVQGADDPGGLRLFKSQLCDLHNVLNEIPSRVAPTPGVPPMPNRQDENFVRWMLLLLWIGGSENRVFHSEIEATPDIDDFRSNGRVQKWNEFSTVPGFDPLSVLTLTSEPARGIDFWAKEHLAAGRRLPDIFAGSLTKPILYASVNAIDLLLQRGHEHRQPARRRLQKRVLRNGDELSGQEVQLLSLLRSYHGGQGGNPVWTPLTQDEMAARLGVSQETVSRTLTRLLSRIAFGPGLKTAERYRRLCEQHELLGVLEHLDNPRSFHEYTTSEFDHLESHNR